ncbi:hypothetical protein [Carbonactinospora thermoautotrophica]|nr:hypothetical protein [Carbonactinospora thermoautotrophica]
MSTTVPGDSLVALAERKQLPRHQYMDATTVGWITAHRPSFRTARDPELPALRPFARRLLPLTGLPLTWYAEPRLADSIHGVRHAMRTAALAALLAETRKLGTEETVTLIVAAAVHDCRREHDQDDRGHGERGARWLLRSAAMVLEHFGLPNNQPERIRQAAVAIRLHEIPYAEFTPVDETDHATARTVSDLLKTADALDRYRLPKLKWWPDDRFVRVVAPDRLKEFAFDLVVRSESAYAAGIGSTESVITALTDRGLV